MKNKKKNRKRNNNRNSISKKKINDNNLIKKQHEERIRLEKIKELEKQIECERKKNIIVKISIIVTLLILLLIIYFNFFHIKEVKMLIGNNEEIVNVYDKYVDQGMIFKVGNIYKDYKLLEYKTINKVNTNKLGTYKVIYKLTYKGKTDIVTRIVRVVDKEAPIIEVDDSITIKACQDLTVNYSANDNYDKDITSKVIKKEEKDKVILSVKDSSNNITKKEVDIIRIKENIPIITLNGYSTIYLKRGNSYTEMGAQAKDDCGNVLNVSIDGSVDINKDGTYVINYMASNKSGDSNKVTRKVIVYNPTSNVNNIVNGYKVIYLTFDDGPGQYTSRILDILKDYGVKATFFVTAQFPSYLDMISREHNEGHSVGIHTYSHRWDIYSSIDTFMNDLNSMNNVIKQKTGSYSKIMRFAGGSSNTVSRNYAQGIMSALVSHVTKSGYTYFDWNISSGDTVLNDANRIYSSVVNSLSNGNNIVLMHDIKYYTMLALPSIINYGLGNGYTFATLNESSPTVHHGINN